MNSKLAPIILFVYNRPLHTRKTLEALSKNAMADKSVLYIYADGPRKNADEDQLHKIEKVRRVIRKKKWCGKVNIVETDKNKGLANSVMDGVTSVINKFGKVIVLEDDLITAKGFLKYMNEALEKYEKEEKVMQVSGHLFPVKTIHPEHASFFLPYATTWGWATWKRSWVKFDKNAIGYEELKTNTELSFRFDLDGSFSFTKMILLQMEAQNIDSWGVRWWWTIFKLDGLTLFPDKSLVKNIGFHREATHTKDMTFYDMEFDGKYYIQNYPETLNINKINFEKLKTYFRDIPSVKTNYTDKSSINDLVKFVLFFLPSKMKKIIKRIIGGNSILILKELKLHKKYVNFTMIPKNLFIGNLQLCLQTKQIEGCVVECGVWKGGMIASMAEVMGKEREYFLFDGFEGMPPAKEIDGKKALDWQRDKSSPNYLDNCKTDISFAQNAMKMSATPNYKIIKGWFDDTIPSFVPPEKIAILRLDCDWYDSMMICLDTFYKYMTPGGLIILDDYLVYEGCSRAVHDFLSKNNSPLMIRQHTSGVPYIINKI